MPYWPSSRITPQGGDTGSTKKTSRGGRKKGITIEDLKAQTAMRLAQEHGAPRPYTPDRVSEAPYVPTHESPFTEPLAPYNSPPRTPHRHSSNSNNSSNKLPHGLTVQELKQMTQARLQAETRPSPVGWESTSTSSTSQQNDLEDYMLGRVRSNPEPTRRRAATYSPSSHLHHPMDPYPSTQLPEAPRARTSSTPALNSSNDNWIRSLNQDSGVPLVTGLSLDVFREPSPLGFGSGLTTTATGSSSLFSSAIDSKLGSSSLLRGRAATWSPEDNLSDDLAWILKLDSTEDEERRQS